MKHLQLFEDFQNEISEASKQWSRIGEGDRAQLCRFYGKTFPCIIYIDGKLIGRDDNGKNPSKSYEENPSIEGYDSIIKHISTPHPSKEDRDWLLAQAEK